MDKAGELMSSLPPDRAARDMGGAIDHCLLLMPVHRHKQGVVGFCMGGILTMVSALESDRVSVAAPYYGAPLGDGAPNWNGLTAKVEGHFAAHDDFFPPEAIKELESQLQGMGGMSLSMYEGTGHAFANEEDALGTFDTLLPHKRGKEQLAY